MRDCIASGDTSFDIVADVAVDGAFTVSNGISGCWLVRMTFRGLRFEMS
jgi:hypothetical protein